MAGSVGFFLMLGLASIYLGLIWGELFQSQIFLGALSLFLLFSAIATFANWSMPLPQFFYKIPARKYLGAMLIGAFAGILSTPCSGPFLGAVLAYSVTLPPSGVIVLFLSIGTGLAFPYVILLIWPQFLNKLQFSGIWTLQIKHILGFILIGGALFFSSALVPETLHKAGWILLIIAILIWAIMFIIKPNEWSQRVFPAIAIFLITSIAIVTTASIKPAHNELNWQSFNETLIKQARANKRPVMIEFTADWCINCKVLEKTVFKSKKVMAAIKKAGMVTLRVDLTQVNKKNKAILAKYKGYALPYVVLLDKQGSMSEHFTGIFKPKTLVDAIIKTVETL
jgi:thiol:disulfide interchange protein DsbD